MLTLADFPDLTPAEQRLIDWLRARDRRECEISDGVPANNTPAVRLRASLLRALTLAQVQDVPLPETGLQVQGAWVAGDGPEGAERSGLDLEGCTLPGDLALFACHLPDMVLLRSAKVRSVFLDGCTLARGLSADGLQAEGGVFLRDVQAKGAVRLLGARLGGDLTCTGARFEVSEGDALSADRLQAEGGVFLDAVQAKGEVRLPGARLGGDLTCEGAQFTALAGGTALQLDRARITGALFLRGGTQVQGRLVLTAAEIGAICDDPACWPAPGDLILDRCRYGAFTGRAPVDAASRIRWLALQDPSKGGQEFWPQPYEECARALREAGHSGAARAVLIEKERLSRAAKRARIGRELSDARALRAGAAPQAGYRPHTDRVIGAWLRLMLASVWDGIVGAVIGYGRKPQNAAVWLLGFWLVGAVIFGHAGGYGAIKPNDPRTQFLPEWADCAEGGALRAKAAYPSHYHCFTAQPRATGYPQFNALVYSADTLIPVVSFEMQSYWLPDDRTPRGAWVRVYLWLHITMGWALTLLAVAGFSGLVKQDSK